MVGAERPSSIFYVSGRASDPMTTVLYRVNAETGERAEMAQWTRPYAVDRGVIAFAPGRLFVATISTDKQKGTTQTGVAGFDAASGKRLWERSYDQPLALFLPHTASRKFRQSR